MEISGAGKSSNTSFSFRYNANNEELEELCDVCEDDPPTPQFDVSPSVQSENASPRRADKTPSILDKYFKSMRAADRQTPEKEKEEKPVESKPSDERSSPAKEVTASPMKEYLNRLGKRSVSETSDVKDVGSNETWKIFHDFKFKIAQAVEDMKTRSGEDSKEKSLPRDNSISDSEENSAIKDSDQSVGDTDNQVSSLNSSIQNLSELTQPLTAKAFEGEISLPYDFKNNSDSSDFTPKNIACSEITDLKKDFLNDTGIMEVESGVEALEDGIDGLPNIEKNVDLITKPQETQPIPACPTPSNSIATPVNKINLHKSQDGGNKKVYFFTFTLYFLTSLVFVNFFIFPDYSIWNGFVLGIWVFYLVSSVKQWFLDTYFGEWEPYKHSYFQLKRTNTTPFRYTIPSVKEHRPFKKYEGWINHYIAPNYDPIEYSVNKTSTAFMKLEGCNLRLSYTKVKIPKRALWDEKIEKVEFFQHRLYNLTGAKVILLPKGLVKRRQWSKKYPICIILNEHEKIQVLEKEFTVVEKKPENVSEKKKEQPSQHEMESTETNTSPEKKKKFVWRRKERSSSHSESEPGKEGLRHRLVRKMHRDKKPENPTVVSENPDMQSQTDRNIQFEEPFHDAEADLTTKSITSTKDEGEEDFDDTELTKIKEMLEETELDTVAEGTSEGEWSLHVKDSKENYACVYLFARTGRDKHEWFRRLSISINEATAATADEKSSSEPAADGKDNIEMAVYKLSEKETVAFAKPGAKSEVIPEDETFTATSPHLGVNMESYEKTFWPFMMKIIEAHEKKNLRKCEVGTMCQLEPSPRKSTKSKKKAKESKRASCGSCDCRVLPAEVTWLNTIIARLAYDFMHNQAILAKLQTRIQKKLHTMKLPSFMSPLVVTELSLAGACPLVERVSAPTWDERGVWLDADLRYDGGAYITLLTQINLLKLKEKNTTLEMMATENLICPESDNDMHSFTDKDLLRRSMPAVFDSEAEDSAEPSEDEESPPLQSVDSTENVQGISELNIGSTTEVNAPGSSKKKFLRMVDKIATNKYFQQVTDYKYVKRAMEGLSNTDIKLQVEVQGLEGRLALNLPPPPHDRIWFGFRTNPQLVLKARPAVGARTLRFAHISNWIEQKLSKEFEKILVLPNMEDFMVDTMTPTPIDDD